MATSKRPVGNMLVFDGETEGEIDEFFNNFALEAMMFGWSEAEQAKAIRYCLKGKARRYMLELDETQQADIKEIEKKLRSCLSKAPEFYLNQFYKREVRGGESISSFCHCVQGLLEKGLPGLEKTIRDKLLRSRLLAVAPENLKNFLEMLSDRSWDEVVSILDKSNDYKLISSSQSQEEVVSLVSYRKQFSGKCFYCGKGGHRKTDCWKMREAVRKTDFPDLCLKPALTDGALQKRSTPFERPSQFMRAAPSERPSQFTRAAPFERSSQLTRSAYALRTDELDDLGLNDEVSCNAIGATENALVRVGVDVQAAGIAFEVPMLVDTGSSASFLAPDMLPPPLADEVHNFVNFGKESVLLGLKKINICVNSALNAKSVQCAKGTIKIKLGNWIGDQEFIFMKLRENAILGIDFWRKVKAKFNFANDEILLGEEEKFKVKCRIEKVNNLGITEFSQTKIKLGRKVKLKPNSEQLIRVKISECVDKDDLIMFDPGPIKEIDLKRGLVWANSISKIDDDNSVLISAINLSDDFVELNPEYEIGSIEKADILTVDYDDNMSECDDIKQNWDNIEINPNLSSEQREKLLRLLKKYGSVFQWGENDCGLTDLTKHRIETANAKPIQQAQYRMPEAAKIEVNKQVETMLKNNVIEESHSPWRSPIVLAKKKSENGEARFRFCVDFRKLNAVTIKDSYTLPRIDETIDALGGSYYFTPLDCSGGFWQVPLEDKDKEKTAFCANNKLYQFRVMPFGLSNAPSTFQRLMDNVLRNLTWKYCLVYLDDVIIFSKDFDSHLFRLEEILARFKAANLKLKPSKCKFLMEKVNYLGFLITRNGVKPDPAKIRAIVDIETLSSKDEVKRFLGMMSYYRRFIKDFGTIASCLFELTRPSSEFKWSKEANEAFQTLKRQLVHAPILIYPDFSKDFEIYTDASGVALGAVLVQRKEETLHPICFASRQLNCAEKNYSTSEREMLAIVWAAKHFNAYIYGRHTKFFTDHKPLSTLNKSKEPNGRLYKLLLKLQELDYEIVYFPGSLNNTADFLSRYKSPQVEAKINSLELEMNIDWLEEQIKDKELAIVKMSVKAGDENLSDSVNEEVWKNNIHFLKVKDGILMLKNKDSDDLIIVPSHLRTKICALYHDSITGGHMGFERTYRAILSRFYWPKMKSFIFDYCASCDTCQKFKVKNIKNVWPLVSIKVNKPWDLIGLDFAGPLKLTARGNRHFVLGIDYFSKLIMARAVVDGTADTTVNFVREEILNKHGPPVAILSDQGRNFEAKEFDSFCVKHGIKKIRTTSYHPQCNGLAERSIRTIKQMLAAYVNDKHDDWDLKLGQVVFTYNNTVQSSTGYAPNQIIYGKILPTVSDRKLNVEIQESKKKSQNELIDELKQRLEKVQIAQKKQYDKNVVDKATYKTGDFIVLVNSRQTVGHVRSFEPKYIGPYEIIRQVNDTNYEIIDPKTGKTSVVHYNRMFKYKVREHENFLKFSNDDKNYIHEYCSLDEVLVSARDLALISRIQRRNAQELAAKNEANQEDNESDDVKDDPKDDIIDKEDDPENQDGNESENEQEDDNFKKQDLIDKEEEEFRSMENLFDEEEDNEEVDDDKEYKCDSCDFLAKSEKGLKIHKTKKHKE